MTDQEKIAELEQRLSDLEKLDGVVNHLIRQVAEIIVQTGVKMNYLKGVCSRCGRSLLGRKRCATCGQENVTA